VPSAPPRRYVYCDWCGAAAPAYKAGYACRKCHCPYSISLDYMYFLNAVRVVLRLAPLERHPPRRSHS